MCFLRLTLRVCVMEDEPVVFLAVLCDVTLTLDTEPGMQFPQGGSLRAVGGGRMNPWVGLELGVPAFWRSGH